ncbi:MAG: hypothetical protein QM747_15110 [Nocardioides sp.]
MTTNFAGAIPVTSVTCPSWCQVTQQEHLDDLDGWEGRCIHWNRSRASTDLDWRGDPRWFVDHVASSWVDGSPDEEAPSEFAHCPESMPLDDAEAFARAILAAVEEARS